MPKRQCDRCKGTMPERMSRQRDEKGKLVCDSCAKEKEPHWASLASLTDAEQAEYHRRAAEALAAIHRTSSQKTAHDSGDSALIHHCPFCGSGAVTGGSDGSVDCDYCHSVFTVQVQPKHPNMPQTIDGQQMPPPGMPAGTETELSAPIDPAVDEEADGTLADPLGDAEADPVEAAGQATPEEDNNPVPPQFRQSSRFFTSDGEVLDLDRYLARLALDHSEDRLAVLAKVRERNA